MKAQQNSLRPGVLGVLLMLFVSVTFHAQAQDHPDLISLKSTLEKWVDTKTLISKEKQQSREEEQMLRSRIDLLELRLREVNEQTRKIRENTGKTGDQESLLNAEMNELQDALSLLEERIAGIEARTVSLLAAAPTPIQDRLAALSQQIPKDPETTKRSLSLRYQNVIGILNSLNNFNNEVTLSTEVRQLDGDQSVEVRVLYFGLGQAYFSNQDATIGGIGRPGPQGWTWERQDAAAPVVSDMIAQYLNEVPADYEAVPVKITTYRNED